ncbi:MAG TPA: hypothetical protein VNI34_08725 [Candidatus Nitrosotalea sp.]|nr:hypothetical protein [Candidatus Nitrosotalea sp.]
MERAPGLNPGFPVDDRRHGLAAEPRLPADRDLLHRGGLGVRREIVAAMTHPDHDLYALAQEVEAMFPGRRVVVSAFPHRAVEVDFGSPLGPRVRCLIHDSRMHMSLDWGQEEQAEAVRARLPIQLEDPFRLGPGQRPGGDACIIEVAYPRDALPADHRLRNDVQALVMLAELLQD